MQFAYILSLELYARPGLTSPQLYIGVFRVGLQRKYSKASDAMHLDLQTSPARQVESLAVELHQVSSSLQKTRLPEFEKS